MKYAIAITYFLMLGIMLNAWRPLERKALMYGVLTLCLLILFAVLNDSIGLIEEKVASFVAYDMYKGDSFQIGFLIQYLFAWVPFSLLDYEYSAHGVNIGLQAFTFMLAAQHIFSGRLNWKLVAFLLFPSYYHYAIFGLRDPYINLLSVLVAISAFHIGKRQFVAMCFALAVLGIGIRPEFSLIIFGFAAIRLYIDASTRQRVVIALTALVGLYVMLLIMPYAFGFPNTGSAAGNIAALDTFNELRANRRLGQDYGSGSHILGGALYGYGLYIRYPIQVLASFVAPLPIDIRGALDIFAFAESCLFCVIVWLAFRGRKRHPTALLLFWCGMAYMLLQALFAANYGNILRVRYPALIFFLASAVAADRVPVPRRAPVGRRSVSAPRRASASRGARFRPAVRSVAVRPRTAESE